jgi:hypothetical protein
MQVLLEKRESRLGGQRKSPTFTEHKGAKSFLKTPDTEPYPELNAPNPHLHMLLL